MACIQDVATEAVYPVPRRSAYVVVDPDPGLWSMTLPSLVTVHRDSADCDPIVLQLKCQLGSCTIISKSVTASASSFTQSDRSLRCPHARKVLEYLQAQDPNLLLLIPKGPGTGDANIDPRVSDVHFDEKQGRWLWSGPIQRTPADFMPYYASNCHKPTSERFPPDLKRSMSLMAAAAASAPIEQWSWSGHTHSAPRGPDLCAPTKDLSQCTCRCGNPSWLLLPQRRQVLVFGVAGPVICSAEEWTCHCGTKEGCHPPEADGWDNHIWLVTRNKGFHTYLFLDFLLEVQQSNGECGHTQGSYVQSYNNRIAAGGSTMTVDSHDISAALMTYVRQLLLSLYASP